MSKKVLFVASEGLPFIKSGGLADVIGALPKSLLTKKIDVRVVIPLYKKIAENHFSELEFVTTFPVKYGNIDTTASVFQTIEDGVIFYFIQHQGYFERDTLYGYGDDGERFGYFQRVVLDMLPLINFMPDLIHCHDWHTGMIPFLGKIVYGKNYQNIKYVFTIHNLAYQGIFPTEVLWSCLGVGMEHYNSGELQFDGCVNFMKAGIIFADKITTVSPTYANEILSDTFGERLNGVLCERASDIWGIVNGIDLDLWNPKTDKLLAKNYDKRNYLSGKLENKLALQETLGLRVDKDVMVIGMVSRLTWQKGVNLIIDKLSKIMGNDVQLVILGTGESFAESEFKKMEYDYRRRAVYYCGYNEDLAHLIYAGSDVFLMPSLFEPCGISQLIAMRYGTLPFVRETGGLRDTVVPYNKFTKEGTGFSFASYNSDEFLYVLNLAIDLYYQNKDDFKKLIKGAMSYDSSWKGSVELYFQLYDMLMSFK